MVFVRGGDNQLYVDQLNGSTWSGWQPLGGTLTADPTAASYGTNGQYVIVFTRGANGETNYRRWNGAAWEDWNALGGWVAGDLSAVSADVAFVDGGGFTGHSIYLFGRGSDNAAYLNKFDGGNFTGWQRLGGTLNSDPVASAWLPGDITGASDRVIFASRDGNNAVTLNAAQVRHAFGGWQGVGGLTTLPVTVATLIGGGDYHVFAQDPTTGVMYDREGFYTSHDDKPIHLRAHANNMFVCADNDGADPLIANRSAAGAWETFDEIDLANGDIALRAVNVSYVTAENAGASPLIANSESLGGWESFQLVRNPDGSVSLLSRPDNMYVTAENAGTQPLVANRTAIGPWEEFDLIPA